ncbi:hypothetical protein FHX11_003962 [Rhizobium sp. BK602]|nr:hypothetical protein [Rhizobium sp. BK602]
MCERCAVDVSGWTGSHIGRSRPENSLSPDSRPVMASTVGRKWNFRGFSPVIQSKETVGRNASAVFVSSINRAVSPVNISHPMGFIQQGYVL